MHITEYLKEKAKLYKSDITVYRVSQSCFLLSIFLFVYTFENDSYIYYVRSVCNLIISMVGFFFLRKGLVISMSLYSFVVLFLTPVLNFTDWFIILLSTRCMKNKYRNIFIVVYIVVATCFFYHNDVDMLLYLIYVINCCAFYFMVDGLSVEKVEDIPVLTDEEKYILDELCSGKLQKEIDGYSENTITKKLKNAMERNNYKTKEELKMKYIQSQHNRIQSNEQSNRAV